MRPDLQKLNAAIVPLFEVHGVELVALEWFQGSGGQGLLRLTMDFPLGDPRVKDPAKSVPLDTVTRVTRDVSNMLDTVELIAVAYTLEVGSPGTERPVQKRADYDRFKGLMVNLQLKPAIEGRQKLNGEIKGTIDQGTEGNFSVQVACEGKVFDVPRGQISRASLHEIKDKPRAKPGKVNTKATR